MSKIKRTLEIIGDNMAVTDTQVSQNTPRLQQIRSMLVIPTELRICQHIYNQMRQFEIQNDNHVGIDIFNVSDEEFMKKLNLDI